MLLEDKQLRTVSPLLFAYKFWGYELQLQQKKIRDMTLIHEMNERHVNQHGKKPYRVFLQHCFRDLIISPFETCWNFVSK
jgi:hypothetical protein